ncbi:MAG: 5-formyltetrahydrofolate cyclo-ligase [Deltaproteobacteria bacterium]|nr:5-formyltetrahydrofolate cyclo-ligase [Deltaproteobacteria bacterium]
MKKDKLRAWALKKRMGMSEQEVRAKSALICQKLLNFLKEKQEKRVMLYYAIRNEVDLKPLAIRLLTLGYKISLPVVKNEGIIPVSIDHYDRCCKKGYKGIYEPCLLEGRIVHKNEIDAVVVPGIAFNQRGYRVGYGKGFYDHFLKSLKAIKLGAAYNWQIISFKEEEYDVPVDIVFTENSVLRREK